jgi:hypothetical protein
MACDPNQSDFIVPIEYDLREYSNFTLLALENVRHREKSESSEADKKFENNYDKYDYESEDTSNVEDRRKRQEPVDGDEEEIDQGEEDTYDNNENQVSDQTHPTHKSSHSSHHSTPKMTTISHNHKETEKHKRQIVTKIRYFLKEEFLNQLIQSCR